MNRVVIFSALVISIFLLIFIESVKATDPIIEKSELLISKKKYASAYKLLNKAEIKTKSIDYLIKRQELLLKYGISTNKHQTFYIKDIKSEQEILNFSENSKGFLKVNYDAISLFDSLLKKDPNNCKLNKAYGEYYFDAYLKYSENWIISKKDLLQRIAIYNEKATYSTCAEAINYYALGQVLINKNKFKESIYFFNIAVTKDSVNAYYLYNLAYAYLFVRNNEKAIVHAQKAIKYSTNTLLSNDAYRLIGQAYVDMKEYDKAIRNFELADRLDTTSYANKMSIINVYLKTNNPNWDSILNIVYEYAKYDVQFYNLTERVFESNQALDKLLLVYENLYKKNESNDTLAGNLLYFMGRIHSYSNIEKARNMYLSSKDRFEKIYQKDHNVFVVIRESIDALNEYDNELDRSKK